MTISFLTSGFPDGFTDEFIERLKRYYIQQGSLVFIASDFTVHDRTDKYMNLFVHMFKEKGIVFDHIQVIDSRVSKVEALELLKKADIVWLSGGDTLKQIDSIKEHDLIPYLQTRDGITIGMSAGSINMAKRVVLAQDTEDNRLGLSIYDGIGLVDINIEPHFDTERKEHMNDIYEASKHAIIYGLSDHSFIEVVGDSIEFFGPYIKFENGRTS